MDNKNTLIESLAKEYKLPIIGDTTHIWFFRTQSGAYFFDFYKNGFIALGWDLAPEKLVVDSKTSYSEKKNEIIKLYPDEKRPGLILGQLETFYNRMQPNDLVAIPAAGGNTIAIGILGEIVTEIAHFPSDEEYERCEYKHKRKVAWLKRVDVQTDVYLLKVLRAQQTISDITEYAGMIYRNLHPCYIAEDGIHLMLQKKTARQYSVKNSIDLQTAIFEIQSTLADYYEDHDKSDEIVIKTAVGSPGFIELILPRIPISVITGLVVFLGIVGRTKSDNGEVNTGLMAILTKVNELLNDHKARLKTDAEIKEIEANAEKTKAEAARVNAETRKLNAEADAIEQENKRDVAPTVTIIEKSTEKLSEAAQQSGITFDAPLEEAG